MKTISLLTGNVSDTGVQVLKENQIVVHHGMGASEARFVVHKAEYRNGGFLYHLINLDTREFQVTDHPQPLSKKFGIGMYYNDTTPEFMDAFEVLMLRSEAEYKAKAEQEAMRKENKRREQLKAVGRERLQNLIPAGAQAIIVAELHEDDSDSMTDYFGCHTTRTVILGFSAHTRDLFSEMRKCAAHFGETAHLAEERKEYEHRKKYSMGAGYFLGTNRYSGWIVRKERLSGERERNIERYALTAGEEANICVKAQRADNTIPQAPDATGKSLIVDYSEKALAVFGDTRRVKDELKALGGRFNPTLSHEGNKRAGWIFSKSKEKDLRDLLTGNQ